MGNILGVLRIEKKKNECRRLGSKKSMEEDAMIYSNYLWRKWTYAKLSSIEQGSILSLPWQEQKPDKLLIL